MNSEIENCIVYVIDDDALLLESIEWLLQSVPFNVQTYVSGQAFLDDVDAQYPGCVVTDLRMPQMGGMELYNAMQKELDCLPVIIMTAHGRIPQAVSALKQGAFDFIEKPFDDQQFIDSINEALRQSVEKINSEKKVHIVRHRYTRLTSREQQVCTLVASGSTNRNISEALNISDKTVEVHRSQMMAKMEASSLAHLIGMLIYAGLHEPEITS